MNWWSIFKVVGVILILLTIPFWIWDIDLYLESLFYNAAKGGFYLKDEPLWDALYKFGIFPGLIAAIVSLLFISISYWNERFIKFRKPAALMVFSLILGPGLVINAILKDNYGRPRPGQIIEFGGVEKHLKVLIPSSGNGKSFPCGHGSIGFYMALPFLFLRRSNKVLAYGFLVGGTAFGFLMSIARMLAGGHFASDVLWALGLVWLSAIAIAAWIKLDEPITKKPSKKQAKRMTVLVGVLLPILTLSVIVATPYSSNMITQIDEKQIQEINTATIFLNQANLIIKDGESLKIDTDVTGFGFPNSKVFQKWDTQENTVSLEKGGWFTELNVNSIITVPQDLEVIIVLSEGKIDNQSSSRNITFDTSEDVEITN